MNFWWLSHLAQGRYYWCVQGARRSKSDSGNPLKHFIAAFAIALIFYLLAYHAIEYRRVRKGPWTVTFTNNSTAVPALIIDQAVIGITNVQILFPGQSASSNRGSQTLGFAQPRPVPYDVPFGQCIFMDTTFLPGTVTFRLFGHEIELLPRVLIIDHQEHRWMSRDTISLRPAPTTSTSEPSTAKQP